MIRFFECIMNFFFGDGIEIGYFECFRVISCVNFLRLNSRVALDKSADVKFE